MEPERQWLIDEQHPDYGRVVMMGITLGEPYRWFRNSKGTISMIPLSALQEQVDAIMAAFEAGKGGE